MYGSAMMHIGTLVVIFIHYGKYANTVLLRSCVSMVETELRYFIVQQTDFCDAWLREDCTNFIKNIVRITLQRYIIIDSF